MVLSEDDAIRLLVEIYDTGREGFFCLKSSKNLTLTETLLTYWKKDSNDAIHSLKNEIDIKSIRIWADNSIYRALIIGIIAQVFVSIILFKIPELKHTSTKIFKTTLSNLTVTVDSWMRKTKRFIHSNFDAINTINLYHNWAIT